MNSVSCWNWSKLQTNTHTKFGFLSFRKSFDGTKLCIVFQNNTKHTKIESVVFGTSLSTAASKNKIKREQIVLYYKRFINKQNESRCNKHMSKDMDFNIDSILLSHHTQSVYLHIVSYFVYVSAVAVKWIHIAHLLVTSGLRVKKNRTRNMLHNNTTNN